MGSFDYLRKTTDPADVIARVQAGLAARAQELRQRQKLEPDPSAPQYILTVRSKATCSRCCAELGAAAHP